MRKTYKKPLIYKKQDMKHNKASSMTATCIGKLKGTKTFLTTYNFIGTTNAFSQAKIVYLIAIHCCKGDWRLGAYCPSSSNVIRTYIKIPHRLSLGFHSEWRRWTSDCNSNQ